MSRLALTFTRAWSLAILLALSAPSPNARAQETGPEAAAPDDPDPASQEVDVSEETFRRYMELKDSNVNRPSLPPLPDASKTGLEKMDDLPEESRRHLRDQLREIILGGDPWTPDSAMERYPFEPSAAASKDPDLRQKETEAWGELVGKYHQREAEQYARRQQTGGSAGGSPGTQGDGQGQGAEGGGGGGSQGQSGEGQQGSSAAEAARQANRAAAQDSPESQSVNSQRPPAEGATESALDYLTGLAGGNSAVGRLTPSRGTDPSGTARDASGAPPSGEDMPRSAQSSAPESASGESAGEQPKEAAEGQPGEQSGEQSGEQGAAESQDAPRMADRSVIPPDPSQESSRRTATPAAEGDTESALDYLTGGVGEQDQPAKVGLLTLDELETVRGIGGGGDRREDDPEPPEDGG